jgi:Polysaccharide deacetylase
MIAISFDVDWAPDPAIEETLELVDEAGVRTTIFATHPTPVLDGLRGHEVGIHPNFLEGGREGWAPAIDELLEAYPGARGARSHAYHANSPILDLFVDRGLLYDSNILMFGHPSIRGFRAPNGLIRLPVFWEDDDNWAVGDWDPASLEMDDPEALYIFDLHPIHVFLNTESAARYEAAKPHYRDAERLREHVNPESSGTGSRIFLKRLLDRPADDFVTLEEIARQFDSAADTPVVGGGT